MRDASTIKVEWQEDGSATALARVTARDATGQYTGVSGEGKWVKQADLSSITCNIYQRTGTTTPDTATSSPTVTISTSILDTPDVTGEIWDLDSVGYNFRFDFPATSFPTGGQSYLAEFLFVASGGSKWAVQYEGEAKAVVAT